MSLYFLSRDLYFPDTSEADEDGLLAVGGDLSADRLLLAYRKGIFPWYNDGQPILWWFPNPRFVLFPDELKVSKSMRSVYNKNTFHFSIDTAFEKVIRSCKKVSRKEQEGTWITDELEEAYIHLHKLGYAHSAETWKDGELVGGLYGVLLGKIFFGESMFSKETNASKFAMINYVSALKEQGVQLIDCQVHTQHLESLGARMISKSVFSEILQSLID